MWYDRQYRTGFGGQYNLLCLNKDSLPEKNERPAKLKKKQFK